MTRVWLACSALCYICIYFLNLAQTARSQITANVMHRRHTPFRGAHGVIVDHSGRGFVHRTRHQFQAPDPTVAEAYMDDLLKDPTAARTKLVGNFTKRNRIAVVYMCFERAEVIRRSLPAVMRSDGIEQFDLFVSQDGGTDYVVDIDLHFPESASITYIRHRANLCTGLHHHFVKTFTFDIMGYEGLIIVEEDNVIHPQSLLMLSRMIDLSVSEPTIGIVSLLDMDNSAFLDAFRFSTGIIPVNYTWGHLWVYGFHKSRYAVARADLADYYAVIKGQDYRMKHEPPLSDKIRSLLIAKGFPSEGELSQDRFFLYSLAKSGYSKRYQTLFRFFEPIGYLGLHHRHTETQFFNMFGRGMFNGRIRPEAAADITKDLANLVAIKEGMRQRINRVWLQYFPREVHEPLVNNTFNSMMEGRLNGVEAMVDFRNAGLKYLAMKQAGRQ